MTIKYSNTKYDNINNTPINDIYYNERYIDYGVFPPPGSSVMILETGEYMITEIAANFMITEG